MNFNKNETTAEEILLKAKIKLLEEIASHSSHVNYGIRSKANNVFHEMTDNVKHNSKEEIVTLSTKTWKNLVDFLRIAMKDEWDGFGGFPDSEVTQMQIKKEVLKTLH